MAVGRKTGSMVIWAAVVFVVLAVNSAWASDEGASLQKPLRVLFIGNSYVYCNDLPAMLANLAASADPPLVVRTGQFAPGGHTLEDHWNDRKPREAIRSRHWDVVVLQEQSLRPVLAPRKMAAFARKFDAEVKSAGARSVLYMTWARQQMPTMTNTLARVYCRLGALLDARVAPVGLAFQHWGRRHPVHTLYQADGSHPTVYGTYLAACVIYATISDRSPVGLSRLGLTADTAGMLQQVAAEVLGRGGTAVCQGLR